VREPAAEVAVVEPVLAESDVTSGDVSPTTAGFLADESDVGEGLRAVGTRLRLQKKDERLRTLAVVSSIPGEGKTSVALGLAAAFARLGSKVLLIDADLRRRDLCPMLRIEPTQGLAEWLEQGHEFVPVRKVAPAGFYVLAAGLVPCRPELLGSPRMPRLLAAAERGFDPVILDCAPLLPVADSLELSHSVAAFLVVVRTRFTPRGAVRRAASLLKPEKLVGMVLNAESSGLSKRRGYRYAYGYKDWNQHKPIQDKSGRLSRLV
jgi:capsular exopolysaccharide synthesis family protein